MKKILKITKQVIDGKDFYSFYDSVEDALFSVECSTKILKGKDLFEKVYQNDANELVEVEIDLSCLSDEDKKCFGYHVKDLFKEIDDAIKKQFPSQSSENSSIN